MFTLLSQQAVSNTPRRAALYLSCTSHVCALIAMTWFSAFNASMVRFDITTVHAGTEEPVRNPEPLYAPLRNSIRRRLDPTNLTQRLGVIESPRQTEPNEGAGSTRTALPSEFLALLDPNVGLEPAVGLALAGTRTIAPLPVAESSLPPPEPPPGEPDITPPPVIGGRLEPAEPIKQTMPAYPTMARNARVEGVVVLAGTVGINGNIEDLHVVEGHPLLVDEALRAVRKWKYRPAILNGKPTPSPVTISVRFSLQYPGD